MTEHRAKPEQWAADRYDWHHADTEALHGDTAFRCIMELRARVEALEAAQRVILSPSSNRTHLGLTQDAPAPSHSLVERVAYAIYINAMAGDSEQALAAIHAIADWFEQQGSHTTAARLRQEAG